MIALLPEFIPPVRARVVADHGDTIALVYRHPEGWTCRTTRPRSAVRLEADQSTPHAAEAGRILDLLRGPDRYYLAQAKADARDLLIAVDGSSPRAWSAMAARLEEMC